MKRNLYPKKLVENLISSAQSKHAKVKDGKKVTKDQEPIATIPYVKGLLERLKMMCRDDLMIVGKGDNTLKKSSRLKDNTPKLLQSCLVHKITCECSFVYTGETLQLLKDRIYEAWGCALILNFSSSTLPRMNVISGY